MQPLPAWWGKWLSTSADISEYFLWIVGFYGEGGGSSPYSSLGMKLALKNWAEMDSFLIHHLIYFKYSQAVLGPAHHFAHFFLRGLNEG